MPPKADKQTRDKPQDMESLVRRVEELGEKIRRLEATIAQLQQATAVHLKRRGRA